MKFLIVDDEPLIRHFCTIVLENYFEASEVVECKNSLEAIEEVKSSSSFSLIICDQEMPGGNGHLLIEYLQSVNDQTPFLFHTSCELEDFKEISSLVDKHIHYNYAQKPCKLKSLKNHIQAALDVPKLTPKDYRRIRISYFLRYNKSLCDIYIKLNDQKFLKFINAHEAYKKSDIDKYVDKNLKFLYIKDADMENFTTKYSTTPFLQFIDDEGPDDSVEDSLVRIHAVLKDLLESVGVDKHVPKLAESYFNKISNITSNNSVVSELLFKLRKRNDYIYDHSFMTACLSSFLLKKLSWGTTAMQEKLCHASLLHDVTISDPEIAMIHDLDSSKMRTFSKEEIDNFKNHTTDVVNLIKNEEFFDPDVEYLLNTHHEKCDGSGFPRKLTGQSLRPLSCVFILCHEFVRLMYLQNFDERAHKDILTYLFNTYNTGHFKDILDALYSTLELNPIYEDA